MQERNIFLDYFKLLLALLVITIHLDPYPDSAADFLGNGIARIAVPCFLIINGYFLAPIISDKQKFIAYIKKLLVIYFVWMIIYSGFYIEPFFHIHSLKDLLKQSLVIFTGYGHMWYIASLIMGSLILYGVKNINKYILLIASLLLFLFGYFIYLLQTMDTNSFSAHIQSALSFLYLYKGNLIRNFLFMGFPFLFLGYYIQKEKTVLQIKKNTHIILLLLCALAFFIESKLFTHYTQNLFSVGHDYRITIFFLCPLLVLFIINHPIIKTNDGFYSKLATAIYFIHPLIIHTLPIEYGSYKYISLVVFISVVYGVVAMQLNKRLKIFF